MAIARGLIAVDKKGGKVLFLNPVTYETEVVIDGLEKNVHELLVVPETSRAYVPIFGDGIHGRNPNPQYLVCVFDLEKRALLATIDLRPCIAPHTLRLGPDGLIYITCENSAAVAVIDRKINKVVDKIDSGSNNCHRLIIAPDGQRLYTENEEDATISVIDLPMRKLIGKITTPRPLAGIAISADSRTIVAVDDTEPTLFLIDAQDERVRAERALVGLALFPEGTVQPDGFLVAIPLALGRPWLGFVAFLGGLSAATGMIIVSTLALGTMLSNDVILPALAQIRALRRRWEADPAPMVLAARRFAVVAIIALAYLCYRLIGPAFPLAKIGMMSFAAVAQVLAWVYALRRTPSACSATELNRSIRPTASVAITTKPARSTKASCRRRSRRSARRCHALPHENAAPAAITPASRIIQPRNVTPRCEFGISMLPVCGAGQSAGTPYSIRLPIRFQ